MGLFEEEGDRVGRHHNKLIVVVSGFLRGRAVAVCFSAGNLQPVATALRAKFPGLCLIVCADNDQSPGNPGVPLRPAAQPSFRAVDRTLNQWFKAILP